MFRAGDLVYYDKRACGPTVHRDFFPFVVDEVRAIGVVISNVRTYDSHDGNVSYVWILDEDGKKSSILVDYLELMKEEQ